MNAASADDTGVLTVPTGLDDDLRQDLTSAAWLIASVVAPAVALLAVVIA